MKIRIVRVRTNLWESVGRSLRTRMNFREQNVALDFATNYRHVLNERTNEIFDIDSTAAAV